jgi:hypothetical protein
VWFTYIRLRKEAFAQYLSTVVGKPKGMHARSTMHVHLCPCAAPTTQHVACACPQVRLLYEPALCRMRTTASWPHKTRQDGARSRALSRYRHVPRAMCCLPTTNHMRPRNHMRVYAHAGTWSTPRQVRRRAGALPDHGEGLAHHTREGAWPKVDPGGAPRPCANHHLFLIFR